MDPQPSSLGSQLAQSTLRHAASGLAGLFLAFGLIKGDQETDAASALMWLLAFAWSIWQAYVKQKREAALRSRADNVQENASQALRP